VLGSMPRWRSFFLRQLFQKFLISLSVRPGKCDAICDHLHPQKYIDAAHEQSVAEQTLRN